MIFSNHLEWVHYVERRCLDHRGCHRHHVVVVVVDCCDGGPVHFPLRRRRNLLLQVRLMVVAEVVFVNLSHLRYLVVHCLRFV